MYNKKVEVIVEGNTKIIVPKKATYAQPSKSSVFFNPMAKTNRDISIIAYSAFLKNFNKPKIVLEGLSGVGARGLRIANEIKNIEQVIVNDINENAVKLNTKSSVLNKLTNYKVVHDDVCRFFSMYSKRDMRGAIVDIDPFGSPARYIDCGIRAVMHGGMLSVTATDLQVLHGLFINTCKRRYYGIPIKTEYSNEISIRLLLGSIYLIASRLDITIIPLFVENEYHYYRIYVKIINKPDNKQKIGYIRHCNSCGARDFVSSKSRYCVKCKSKVIFAGPLWNIGLFDKKFVKEMLIESQKIQKSYIKLLKKCFLEADNNEIYFTTDEIASNLHVSPLKLENIIKRLHNNKFNASPTSLHYSGFRTNANVNEIKKIFVI